MLDDAPAGRYPISAAYDVEWTQIPGHRADGAGARRRRAATATFPGVLLAVGSGMIGTF